MRALFGLLLSALPFLAVGQDSNVALVLGGVSLCGSRECLPDEPPPPPPSCSSLTVGTTQVGEKLPYPCVR